MDKSGHSKEVEKPGQAYIIWTKSRYNLDRSSIIWTNLDELELARRRKWWLLCLRSSLYRTLVMRTRYTKNRGRERVCLLPMRRLMVTTRGILLVVATTTACLLTTRTDM
jgi:hypothetical protein